MGDSFAHPNNPSPAVQLKDQSRRLPTKAKGTGAQFPDAEELLLEGQHQDDPRMMFASPIQ